MLRARVLAQLIDEQLTLTCYNLKQTKPCVNNALKASIVSRAINAIKKLTILQP